MSGFDFNKLRRIPWWRRPFVWLAARKAERLRAAEAKVMRCIAVIVGQTKWTDRDNRLEDTQLWECYENTAGSRSVKHTKMVYLSSDQEGHPLYSRLIRPWELGMITTAQLRQRSGERLKA